LSESADAFRNDDAIDAVLQIGVVAAHVQLTVGILHDTGCLQKDLVERLGIPERHLRNRLTFENVLACSDFWRELVA